VSISRPYKIMEELAPLWEAIPTIGAVEIGYRNPSKIENAQLGLARVLIYNPTTAEASRPVFGLQQFEYGFTVLVVGLEGDEDNQLWNAQRMAEVANSAITENADRVYMSPGSVVVSEASKGRTVVVAFLTAEFEGGISAGELD